MTPTASTPGIPSEIAGITRPKEALMKWYFLKALATTFAFPVTIVLLYFRFHTMRYRFDAEGIHMSWGIIVRREVLLNYSRIQDIHLHLERLRAVDGPGSHRDPDGGGSLGIGDDS